MNEMTKIVLNLYCFLFVNLLIGQIPIIKLPDFKIPTQYVYISPLGNDSNPGTYAMPKKTFYAAIDKIDFGLPGINDGQNDGEVILLPGEYYPKSSNSFVQTETQWRKNNNGYYVYKNISITGMGNVIIHGDSLAPGTQMIYLTGDKIRIKNLKILNVPLHGIFCLGSTITHHSDIGIDSVIIDGANGFGILMTGYDRILVEHSTVANTCLSNEHEKGNLCQWASGLRADNCSNVTFRYNIVYHNWGEGINTSLSEYINVHDNLVYDNYSVNIYAHSASNAIYANNLIYNVDSAYWRYCYNGKGFSSGISIANELTCTNACFFWSNTCGSLVSCCSDTDYDHPILTFVNYKQVDSIFIFNNILLGSDIGIWDAFSGINNYANLSNIFIAFNSSVNVFGSDEATKSLISLNLGTPFVNFKNLNIKSNLFSVDLSVANTNNFRAAAPSGICNGNWLSQLTSENNLWSLLPSIPGIDFTKDYEEVQLPLSIKDNEIDKLIPGIAHPELIRSSPLPDYIKEDYFHTLRKSNTNVGAIEINSLTEVGNKSIKNSLVTIRPNPVSDRFQLDSELELLQIDVFDFMGKLITSTNKKIINCSSWPSGMYFYKAKNIQGITSIERFVKK